MEITTIACPPGFTDPNVNPATAPIWTDGTTDYQVASGLMEGYTTSDPIKATADRVIVVVGMSGLDALAAMGLSSKSEDDVNG
jgi:hypothetical protein